jgi:uncharacterized membrane protein
MLYGAHKLKQPATEETMKHESTLTLGPDALAQEFSLELLMQRIRRLFVPAFTFFFLAFALLYAGAAVVEFLRPILSDGDMLEGLVKGLHMGVVALAVYELAQIVAQESSELPGNVVRRIRRGLIRFVSVVCTALVLESLIMVIRYTQKDLAGFLYYPVAIITAAAVLLMALGVFTRLSTGVAAEDEA